MAKIASPARAKSKAKPKKERASLPANDPSANTKNANMHRNEAQATSVPRIACWEYRMDGAVEGAVERYCELTGLPLSSLKNVATPCLHDHLIPIEDFTTQGKVSPHVGQQFSQSGFFIEVVFMCIT